MSSRVAISLKGMTTFVLVPGAGGDAWYWHRVVPLLRAAGHEAIAVDLPSADPRAGLAEYAQIVRAAIGARADVTLVAMSLAGFTAPLVAASTPLTSIVLVNAMIPLPGEKAGDWWDNTGATDARISAAKENGYSTEFDLDTYFLHDVPPDILATSEPPPAEADVVFESPCDFETWPAIPLKVVTGKNDRFFPAAFQRRMARQRLGIAADALPGGHLIALSQPEPLSRYLVSRVMYSFGWPTE
jgi:pimeloyl-ACP methyl ester carboxylesterase